MSAEKIESTLLRCDGDGCNATFSVFEGAVDDLSITRDLAKDGGWFLHRDKDYCEECAKRPRIVCNFADGLHGTPEQNHDMLLMCWQHLRYETIQHFCAEENFVDAVEAEIAARGGHDETA